MDDLLDLNWSSSSSSNNAPSKSKGSNNGNASSASYSAFDSLARPTNAYNSNGNANYMGQYGGGAPAASSSSRTPSPSLMQQPSRASSNGSSNNNNVVNSANDAFSSIFGSSDTSASSRRAKESSLTMQERLKLQNERAFGSSSPLNTAPSKAAIDPWDFDMLSPGLSSTTAAQPPRTSSPFDAFDDVNAQTSAMKVQSQPVNTRHKPNQPSEVDDILGALAKPIQQSTTPLAIPQPRKPTSSSLNPTRTQAPSASSSRPPSRPTAARTPSPPPHVLGQVVAMGFSVQQARLALAATLRSSHPAEWDVNGALEVLASDGAAQAARTRTQPSTFQDSDDEESGKPSSRSNGTRHREQPSRNSQREAHAARLRYEDEDERSTSRRNGGGTESPNTADLVAQASVFGASMLKSANAYWKTSKAQLQKAIEENKLNVPLPSGGGSSGRASPANGRPKWMTQDFADDEEDAAKSNQQHSQKKHSGFRDDDDSGVPDNEDSILPPHPSDLPKPRSSRAHEQRQRDPPESRANETKRRPEPPRQPEAAQPPQQQSTWSRFLAVEPEKASYISPHRRKTPSASPTPPQQQQQQAPDASAISRQRGSNTPTPKPTRPARNKVTASSSQLSASQMNRAIGNDHFKLGRYGEAVDAYSKAIKDLPQQHFARILSLNNRANARLRNGEERRAAEDASAVLVILCGTTDAAKAKKEDYQAILTEFETYAQGEGEGDKLDAPDALGKALSRRAKGYEGCEKWRLAMLDWQMLTELGDQRVIKSAGGMKVISEGLTRCRKVVEGPSATAPSKSHIGTNGSSSASAASVRPRPKPSKPAAPSKSTKPSEAVDQLRQNAQKAEADEAERIRVKDAVEAKITDWRGGKENNLRALIASLDNVLWPELGWQKVGMHELITDSQLKVRYVRAISKVHPDKLGNESSVERKLIANAVFGTLSDAWNAHQAAK